MSRVARVHRRDALEIQRGSERKCQGTNGKAKSHETKPWRRRRRSERLAYWRSSNRSTADIIGG